MTGRGPTAFLVPLCISQEAKLLSTGHWEDSLTLIYSRRCGDHTALQLHNTMKALPRPESADTWMQRGTKPEGHREPRKTSASSHKLPDTLKPPGLYETGHGAGVTAPTSQSQLKRRRF